MEMLRPEELMVEVRGLLRSGWSWGRMWIGGVGSSGNTGIWGSGGGGGE